MTKLTNLNKVIMVAVIAVVFIVLLIVYNNGSGGPVAVNNNTIGQSGAALTAASPTQTQTQTSSAPQTNNGQAVAPRPTPLIHLITPVAKDLWKIGTQNVISWNKPGGFSGSISLINAKTKAFMGVVLPQIGPNQTSYTWNTRDLLLDRTNPLKKDVATGTYYLRLSFDGNNVQPVTSPTFMITN